MVAWDRRAQWVLFSQFPKWPGRMSAPIRQRPAPANAVTMLIRSIARKVQLAGLAFRSCGPRRPALEDRSSIEPPPPIIWHEKFAAPAVGGGRPVTPTPATSAAGMRFWGRQVIWRCLAGRHRR